ncbi:selenoneine biosynthesis selenosugar synthase SenB [Marinobacter sp. F4206]|uniref:selenoneine biosynthesis selenosugar synthase SenB n=1 Tax=Marinobacter sp. F4206 TaxID=2861777 RepID=UPI001C5E6D05|nr:selenoneine biosynthesis selenosugar synthase SenB [Marinobacter sp. F4206]MBW4933211.1 TIGR04348 family glycosyltransferase [Marinobacter sp. F4206]
MKIIMITPAPPGSRAGNRATAERWANLLGQAGHQVTVVTDYAGEPCDAFIALHAWRSHDAIQVFRKCWPQAPLILALTGTDIYRHQREYPLPTRASMAAADVLIGLHDRVAGDIPPEFTNKLITLFQSADAVPRPGSANRNDSSFDVCVIGHLREEKDSLRTAVAARLVPDNSKLRVLCAGKPHNAEWQAMVEQEVAQNPRFEWLGELDQAETRALMARCQLMVISSVMEGGANVVSEACRAGLPILASDIPGNRGLLGEDYEGYFPARDEVSLASLLSRAESEPGFLGRLSAQVAEVAPRFTPENEQRSLEKALQLAVQGRAACSS